MNTALDLHPLHQAIARVRVTMPRDVIDMHDLTRDAIASVFDLAERLSGTPPATARKLFPDKVVATLFYQPSTRTRLNFESAAQRLGASVVGFADPATTRAGDFYQESLDDVIRFTAEIVDLIVLRHFETGAAVRAARVSPVPVISAGDGYGQHPTQALGDIWTMVRCLGDLSRARIGMLGDARIRSLMSISIGLATVGVGEIVYLLPRGKELPSVVRAHLEEHGVAFRLVDHVEVLLAETDLVETIGVNHPDHNLPRHSSATRVTDDDYYRITRARLDRAARGDRPLILHPGPRTDEISTDVDDHECAKYFAQARNGMWVRMALLAACLTIP